MLPDDVPVRRLGVFAGLAAFCEALGFYAASLYAYQLAHSILAVSLVMTAIAVAETVGALLGGTLADRLDRKTVAVFAALAASALLAVLVIGASLLTLTVLMVAATLAASPIRPVIGASLPNLVVDGELEFANGYVQALRNAALTLAPVAAGIGVGVIGARGIFLVAASSLLAAAVVLTFVGGDFHGAAPAEGGSDSWLEGVAFLRRDPVLLLVVVAGAISWLTAAECQIADLPFALSDLRIGETGYGLLVATWGLGMTAGALLAPGLTRRLGAPRLFGAAMLVEGVGLAAVAGSPGVIAAFAAFTAGGIAGGVGAVADQLIVQERVPDWARGRVRATNDAVMAAAYSFSLGLGGLVVAVVGARGTYAIGGVGVVVAGLLVSLVLRRPALRAVT